MIKTDYYNIEDDFTEEQLLIKESTKQWVDKYVKPDIDSYYQQAKPPLHLIKLLAEIGGFGLIIPEEYGGMEADYISYGLMMQELEKGDTSVRVMSSIQTSSVMYAIWQFGSEEQKKRYLPKLAIGELLGAFGLTEPDFGSNPQAMLTSFKKQGDNIILNGSKLWIGNSTTADIAIVWAKNEQGNVQGIIVETDKLKGFSTSKINDKWSFRASITGELIFSDTEIKASQILEKSTSIKDAFKCTNIGRYAIAWGSVGIAMECYETALQYAKERVQFGKPIASYQLIQKKLAEMITEITKAQLLNYRLGVLMNRGKATHQQISMANEIMLKWRIM